MSTPAKRLPPSEGFDGESIGGASATTTGATITGASGAIAREHSRAADIGAWRVDDDRRQFERVAKTEVESLARDRMQRLRSIADDGDTVGRRVARHFQCQRKRAPRADAHETANTVAEVLCELAHEYSVS